MAAGGKGRGHGLAVGDRHPETANVMSILAAACKALGETDAAEALYRELLEISARSWGRGIPRWPSP